MAKYIDAEKIEYPYMTMSMWGLNSKDCHSYNEGIKAVEDKISALPAADVVEVKHGKWYRHDKKTHGDTCYHCSVCEKMALTDCGMVWELTPYCPFCGAKMDGKED